MTVDDLPPPDCYPQLVQHGIFPPIVAYVAYSPALVRSAIAQAVEREREECAKVCEIMADDLDMWRPLDGSRGHALRNAAKRIRSASKENGNG